MPAKDRWKPQLFRKDYPNPRQFTGKINEKDFAEKQMMKTNDRFMAVEEHEHILKMRERDTQRREGRDDPILDANINQQILLPPYNRIYSGEKHTAQTNRRDETDRTESSHSGGNE